MPLKSRLTSPAREARSTSAAEPETQAAPPATEPTTSPRRRTAAPVESENLAKDVAIAEADREEAQAAPEPAEDAQMPDEKPDETPAPRKRGPKPGSKRAVRRIIEPSDNESSINPAEIKSQMKEIEVAAKELAKQHQTDMNELKSEFNRQLGELHEKHKYLAGQLSSALFGM